MFCRRSTTLLNFAKRNSFSTMSGANGAHFQLLTNIYAAAPISGLINVHKIEFDEKGDTTLSGFVPDKKHCHTMGALHGSCYFKLLDDAAFFAAQARETKCFVLTVSFNIILMKPILPGTELTCKGNVTSNSKSVIVADSQLYTTDGTLVASGTGTFMKQPKLTIDDIKKRIGL